jgi:hypothetical protein
MGNAFGRNYIMRIDNTYITLKEFQQIKTYEDVLRFAGYDIKSTDEIDIVPQGQRRRTIQAFERFQFVDVIYYKGKLIIIEKLYGVPGV